MRLRQRNWRIVAAACAFAAGSIPAAAQAEFYPSISVRSAYTDNVYYVLHGLPGSDQKVSDVSNRLEVRLPVVRTWATRMFEASYEGGVEKYRDVSELDNDSHDVRLVYSANGPFNKFSIGASYEHTQTQGDTSNLESPHLVLSQRTDRDLYSMVTKAERRVGRRWRWTGSAEVSRYAYAPIEGVNPGCDPNLDPGCDVIIIEDRDRYLAGFGFSRVLNRSSSLGISYGYELYKLESSGTEKNHLLGLAFRHEVSRDYSFEGQVGGFRRTTNISGTQKTFGGLNFQGGIGFARKLRRLDILASAERVPSSGGALEGTSTDTAALLELRGKPLGRGWRWEYSNRYALRDSNEAGVSTIHAVATSGLVEWFVLRAMGVGFTANYVNQSGSDSELLNGSFWQGALKVTWYPRGIESLQRRATQ
jgi:hypothetical protein